MPARHHACFPCPSNDRLTFECLRYLFALAELLPHVGGYLSTLPVDVMVGPLAVPFS